MDTAPEGLAPCSSVLTGNCRLCPRVACPLSAPHIPHRDEGSPGQRFPLLAVPGGSGHQGPRLICGLLFRITSL